MSKVTIDVLVQVSYDMKDPSKTCIFTNARHEYLDEILCNWVQDQACRRRDLSEPVDRDVYTIKIGLILEDDSFCTESDTGNKGLTCGIVMDVLGRLAGLPVRSLEERGG